LFFSSTYCAWRQWAHDNMSIEPGGGGGDGLVWLFVGERPGRRRKGEQAWRGAGLPSQTCGPAADAVRLHACLSFLFIFFFLVSRVEFQRTEIGSGAFLNGKMLTLQQLGRRCACAGMKRGENSPPKIELLWTCKERKGKKKRSEIDQAREQVMGNNQSSPSRSVLLLCCSCCFASSHQPLIFWSLLSVKHYLTLTLTEPITSSGPCPHPPPWQHPPPSHPHPHHPHHPPPPSPTPLPPGPGRGNRACPPPA
jgi:hypothetical protein